MAGKLFATQACMKKKINLSKVILSKSLQLIEDRFSKEEYLILGSTVSEFLLKQRTILKNLASRSGLDYEMVEKLIQESATILVVTTLAGRDLLRKGLKGAFIGAGVGMVMVLGNITLKVYLFRHPEKMMMESSPSDSELQAYA